MVPQEYFRRLVESFKERILIYRKQIEIMETHMASLSQGQTLTPQGANEAEAGVDIKKMLSCLPCTDVWNLRWNPATALLTYFVPLFYIRYLL